MTVTLYTVKKLYIDSENKEYASCSTEVSVFIYQ